jgi:hypothetical protein
MRILLSLILAYTFSAEAFQFGTGMAPGMQCPYPYGPSNNAYRGDDEIRNLVGGLANAERKLEREEKKLSEINTKISNAKSKIRRVIRSASAIADIERHYKYKANPEDYSQACGRRERSERTASAGGPGANVVNRPAHAAPADGGDEDPGRYAVPSDYCQGGKNDWQYVVAADGMVLDAICDYEIPLSRHRPDEAKSADCREGLEEYYKQQAKKEKLEAEVRALKRKVEAYNEDKERISDQIAEGTYCPYCNSQRRGQSTMGTGNFAMMGVAILGALFNRQPRPQPVLVRVPRRGPPGVLPYGGMPGAPPVMPFPGPSAYPGRPYAAPMPGYYGMQPGFGGPGQAFYGGGPGGIGPGAFGCQGTSPYSFGNPLAAQFDPFNNSRSNPFANPYANDPFSPYNNNLFGQHPLLNPGFGPGIAPYLGNGVSPYTQYDPFSPYNQFAQGAPGVLPYPGAGGPFGQGNNPYAPYGNPWGGPGVLPYPGSQYGNWWNGGANSPYALPYPGAYGAGAYGAGAYGAGAYGLGGAPGVLPYASAGAPYMTNMPGVGSYSAPWGLNPVANYGYQMNQLRAGVAQIGGGLYSAPAVLPYVGGPTGAPVYNAPGGVLNPGPRTSVNGPAPGVLPAR